MSQSNLFKQKHGHGQKSKDPYLLKVLLYKYKLKT